VDYRGREEVIATISDLSGEYQLIVDKAGELDHLKIKAEYVEPVADLARLKRYVTDELERSLMVSVDVELMPKGELPKTMWEAQRIVKAF
jgi:phenylacetate-coenzyme A ligase PaaK-like adenylate-forming protein